MAISQTLKRELLKRFEEHVLFDEPMDQHTTFKVGGPADAYVMPGNEDELVELVELLVDGGISYIVIGNGSNLLVRDKGIRGVVISLTERFKKISGVGEGRNIYRVTAMAGARLATLCRYAIKQGLAGLNFALGIPGSVGGAVLMNAGTAAGAMENVIDRIKVLTNGQFVTFKKSEIGWSYRSVSIPLKKGESSENMIVTKADFLLPSADPQALRAEARDMIRKRKSAQPIQFPSAGCFFKNPATGEPAGKLIDMSGLKGFRIGNAQVSEKHANFIVNRGSASAKEIIEVSETIQKTVADKFKVKLEPEVKIIGE